MKNGGSSPAEIDQNVGERLREARRRQKLSIKAIAEKSNLSTGLISQIERGQTTPSLRSLRVLSSALDVPMSQLFDQSSSANSGEQYIVRRHNRSLLKLSGHVMKELLSPSTASQFEVYEVTLKPGGESGPNSYTHAGEKAGIVLSGILELWLEDSPYRVHEGDVCQFAGEIPHRYCNNGTTDVRVIWVVSPPPP